MKYGYIYKITNKLNGKIYVGQKKSEIFVDSYWGSGIHISASIKKYGIENFDRQILEWCYSKEELQQKEVYWIEKLNSNNPDVGYNLTKGGEGTPGYRWSEESRKKLSEARKGPNNPLYGKHLSEEHRRKIGIASKNLSEENRRKKQIASSGENNPMYGKHHSLETRKKISEMTKKKMQEMNLCGRVYRHVCKNCGKEFTSNGSNSKWCPECKVLLKL